jgi:hypothetical protein
MSRPGPVSRGDRPARHDPPGRLGRPAGQKPMTIVFSSVVPTPRVLSGATTFHDLALPAESAIFSDKSPLGDDPFESNRRTRQEDAGMTGLSAVSKIRITEVLDSTQFRQQGFTVTYDDRDNPMVTITFARSPEYQFVISSTHDGMFTTSERPGIRLPATETFPRSHFELCISAIKEWVERIIDRQNDWIMDEFGGVADMNPALK